MIVTIILAIILMAGLFLMLLAAVGFIQNQKFFSSAPKEVQKVLLAKEERFKGQHLVGWVLMILALMMLVVPIIYGGIDGANHGFTYMDFFIRYAIMGLLLKVFDIVFFDWFLLCHSNFFPHFYPECKGYIGPEVFGFNVKTHIVQIILIIILAAALAGICQIL